MVIVTGKAITPEIQEQLRQEHAERDRANAEARTRMNELMEQISRQQDSDLVDRAGITPK